MISSFSLFFNQKSTFLCMVFSCIIISTFSLIVRHRSSGGTHPQLNKINCSLALGSTRSTETPAYSLQGEKPETYCWLTTPNRTTGSQKGQNYRKCSLTFFQRQLCPWPRQTRTPKQAGPLTKEIKIHEDRKKSRWGNVAKQGKATNYL